MNKIEKDKIITEFMELRLNPETINSDFPQCESPIRQDKSFETMRFHYDWNWLMEVVNKISEYRLAYPEQANKVCNLKIVINKNALYNACVEFAKWYNQQKQQ